MQDEQTQFVNQDCQLYLKYSIDNEVYVDARYFTLEKLKKLLNFKNARP